MKRVPFSMVLLVLYTENNTAFDSLKAPKDRLAKRQSAHITKAAQSDIAMIGLKSRLFFFFRTLSFFIYLHDLFSVAFSSKRPFEMSESLSS